MSLVNEEIRVAGAVSQPDKQVAGVFTGLVVYTVPEGRVFRGFVYNTSSSTTCGIFGVGIQVLTGQKFDVVGVSGASLSGGASHVVFLGVESDA